LTCEHDHKCGLNRWCAGVSADSDAANAAMAIVIIRTDLIVAVAAFHHAKVEEKEVDPLEVSVLCDLRVCLCVRVVCFRRAAHASECCLKDIA